MSDVQITIVGGPQQYTFYDWLGGVSFFCNYSRYGLLGGHGFVVASSYDYRIEDLSAAVDDLDAGDNDAFDARDIIQAMVDNGNAYIANHTDPTEAMRLVVDQWRELYGDITRRE